MSDWTGRTTYTYERKLQLYSVVSPSGQQLTYWHNQLGLRVVMADAYGRRSTYGYDRLDRMTSLVNPWSERTSVSYDVLDREATRRLASNVLQTRKYDAAGRETSISSPVSAYTATAVGNRLTMNDGGRVTAYQYGPGKELTLMIPASGQPQARRPTPRRS